MSIPERFPKIRAPFNRERPEGSGVSYVRPERRNEYDWVFTHNAAAVEKLHGTNVAVELEHGDVVQGATRLGSREMNALDPFGSERHQHITRGIQNTIQRGFLYQHDNGWVSGEVVGPSFHDNPYNLDEHLFIPFDWLREHAVYEDFPYDASFEELREWFDTSLYSHFTARLNGMAPQDASTDSGHFAEGVVFIHPSFTGSVRLSNMETERTSKYEAVATDFAKLRRDMFELLESQRKL